MVPYQKMPPDQFGGHGKYLSVCKNSCIMSSVAQKEYFQVWEITPDDVMKC